MKLPALFPILAGLLMLAAGDLAAPVATAAPRSPDLAEATRLIIDRTNDFRRGEGREPTEPDAKLGGAARGFASFMARAGVFGHEADGRTPAQRAKERGYDYCLVLENIASLSSSAGFGTQELAARVVQGWKDSEGHRQNMLDAEVTDIGVAIARSERSQTYYAVQLFGRPRSKRIEFRIANASPGAVEYELGGRTFSLGPRAIRTHQECRVPRLTVHLPGQRQFTTVRPADGDRYEIERSGAGYRLERKTGSD